MSIELWTTHADDSLLLGVREAIGRLLSRLVADS